MDVEMWFVGKVILKTTVINLAEYHLILVTEFNSLAMASEHWIIRPNIFCNFWRIMSKSGKIDQHFGRNGVIHFLCEDS